jgi:hypothetical protein
MEPMESSVERAARRPVEVSITRPSDRVDISDRAKFLSQLAAMPDERSELVDRVRRELAMGTYETSERLDAAVSNLLDELEVQN